MGQKAKETELVEMKVTGLTIDPFTNMPIIILKDMEEKSALPIWIGLIEASSIATEIENIKLSRPMTHDLMKTIFGEVGIQVIKVEVSDLNDNTFYARLCLEKDGKKMEFDCRPSDALAIALRCKAPIFVDRKVIEKSRKLDLGENKEGADKLKDEKWSEILDNLSIEDFGKYKM